MRTQGNRRPPKGQGRSRGAAVIRRAGFDSLGCHWLSNTALPARPATPTATLAASIRTVTYKSLALLLAVVLGLFACSAEGPASTVNAPRTGNPDARTGGWSPAQLGLIAATGDPAIMPSTPGFSPGVLYVNRVYVDQTGPGHVAHLAVITAGTGITNAFIGVYDPATGKLLASTADISQPLQNAGDVRSPLTSELAAQPINKELWIVLLIGGMAKTPTVIGGREYGSNLGLTEDYRLWVSDDDRFTALPAAMPKLKAPDHSSIPFVAVGP